MVNIGIIGYGVVGSGVYEVIKTNTESIASKAGQEVRVLKILDIRDFPEHEEPELFTKEFDDLLDDRISIVVETMGGAGIAYEFTKKLLAAGKSVVTSNKELVATYGAQLMVLAKENGVRYLFEASVGGGIPIVHPLSQCLAANAISAIHGILNGTTNYILTKMFREGVAYADALSEAQRFGYAEKDPTADVDGHDTCRKIAILTSLVYGSQIKCDKIPTEGIRNITGDDVAFADKLGCSIKLIGYSRVKNGAVTARVCPMMIPRKNPLSTVEDVFNGILVHGNAIGDVMFYGRGAGKLPTASAVVADVIEIIKAPVNSSTYFWKEEKENTYADLGDEETAYCVRVHESALSSAIAAFGNVEITSLRQEIGFVTPVMKETDFNARLSGVKSVISKIKMYTEQGEQV
ncbi:MAG: homoserine dehydrogenase [Clostridia bacterium]|nr:homoserine dehydrogenase [Clostridia bacterium]